MSLSLVAGLKEVRGSVWLQMGLMGAVLLCEGLGWEWDRGSICAHLCTQEAEGLANIEKGNLESGLAEETLKEKPLV